MFSWMKRWPRAAIAALMMTIGLLALDAWGIWSLLHLKASPQVDYVAQLNELLNQQLPPEENEWPEYLALLRRHFGQDDPVTFSDHLSAPIAQLANSSFLKGAWDEIPRTDELRQLRELLPAVDEFSAFALRGRVAAPYNAGDALYESAQPHDLGTRATRVKVTWHNMSVYFALLNTMAMRAGAEAGDWDEVAHRFALGLRSHAIGQNQVTAFERVRDVAVVMFPIRELGTLLNEHDVPEAACHELLSAIESFSWPGRQNLPAMVEAEKLLALDAIQHQSTSSGMPLGSLYSNSRVANFYSPWLPNAKSRGVHHVELDHQFFLSLVDLSPTERKEKERTRSWRWDAETVIHYYSSLAIFAMNSADHVVSALAGLRAGLLLEIHHAQTGAWPKKLTDAMTVEDATDPISGEPFGYTDQLFDDPRPYHLQLPWRRASDDFVINRLRPGFNERRD